MDSYTSISTCDSSPKGQSVSPSQKNFCLLSNKKKVFRYDPIDVMVESESLKGIPSDKNLPTEVLIFDPNEKELDERLVVRRICLTSPKTSHLAAKRSFGEEVEKFEVELSRNASI